MKVTSSRRVLIVTLLLALAVGGALVRWLAPAGSVAHDIGTLLLVMWVPAVGQIIGWLMRRWAERRARAAAPAAPFAPHLRAVLQWVGARPAPGEHACLLLQGSQGFSARARLPAPGAGDEVEIEFKAPQAALPHFPVEAAFSLARGSTVVARGRVVALTPP
jgi:hypothetical protein